MSLHICHGRQPFFRRPPVHYHCGHGGSNNSIFITNNCCGGHTSGWNSFLAGAGFGLTNWLSGFMGMGGFGMNMMNPWGGMFQMAAPFGFQGNGWWNTSGGSDKSEESSKDYDKYAGDKNAGNADTPELRRLTDRFNDLKGSNGNNLKEDLSKLKGELEVLSKNPKDEANETDDKKLYEDLLNRIKAYEKTLNEIPASHIEGKDKTPPAKPVDPDAKKETATRTKCDRKFDVNYLDDFNNFTEDDLADLINKGVKSARDVHGEPNIKPVKGDSWSVNKETLQITLTDTKLPGQVTYDFLGVTEKGEYVFQDINPENGDQLYLLQYKLNGNEKEFYLMQYDGMSGSNSKAHSSNKQ